MDENRNADHLPRKIPSGIRPGAGRLIEVDDSHTGRFGLSPDANGAALNWGWQPGRIEVELTEALHPDLISAGRILLDAAMALFDFNLSALQQILQRRGLLKVEFMLKDLRLNADLSTFSPAEALRALWSRFFTFYFPENADMALIVEELENLSMVRRAVPIPKIAPAVSPSNEALLGPDDQAHQIDPTHHFENQWYIFRCRANAAWKIDIGPGKPPPSGNEVVIADVDLGFRVTHQDLQSRIELTHNSMDNTTNASVGDHIDHGTGVLGIAGAGDNDLGVAGFAYGASLWAVQADDGSAAKFPDSWADAINFVRTTNSRGRRKVLILPCQTADLRNIELVPSINLAIKRAVDDNVVVCVAAGNGDKDAGIDDSNATNLKPIDPTGSILVGATKSAPLLNPRATFNGGATGSNWGARIVVSAPGDEKHDVTCSSRSDDGYRNSFGGTSGAVPKVAGTIALMLEVNPQLSPKDVADILKQSKSKVTTGPPRLMGVFLDTEAAVREALTRRLT